MLRVEGNLVFCATEILEITGQKYSFSPFALFVSDRLRADDVGVLN